MIAASFGIGWFSGNTGNHSFQKHQNMKKVSSIGGIFFKCKNPTAVRKWYEKHLGLNTDQYGTTFEWRQAHDSLKKGFTQWGPFNENTKYFEPSAKDFMINYRVENIRLLVDELKKEGVNVVDEIQSYEYGDFVHIMDIEGNKIELWEPNDIEFEKIVKVRTK